MARRIYAGIMLTLFLACAGAMGTIAWWLLAPYNVVGDYTQFPIVDTKVVRPGGTLIYHGRFCKQSDLPAYLSREFIDGVRYAMPDTVSGYYPQGCQDTRNAVQVPAIPPGTYKFHVTARFKVNPLRTKTYEYWTEPFTVTP